jgi:dienelactone hydrolase
VPQPLPKGGSAVEGGHVISGESWPDELANCGAFADDLLVSAYHSRSLRRDSFQVQNFTRWNDQTADRTRDLLHYVASNAPMAPEHRSRADCGEYVVESFIFSTSPWSRVPCDLLIPKRPRDGSWPAPAVVALHCHGGMFRWGREKIVSPADPLQDSPALVEYRKANYGGRAYANELAQRGYVVAVIDAFFFGERRLLFGHRDWPEPHRGIEARLQPDSEPWIELLNAVHAEYEPRVAGSLYHAGATWPGVFYGDDRRTIDYLETRPEVDPARIACIGFSLGAFRSQLLAALDSRIKAAVAVGWLCSFADLRPMSRWQKTVGWMHYIPGLQQELDLPDIASLICPRPLLAMHGSDDRFFPRDGPKHWIEHVRSVYEKSAAGGFFLGLMVEVDHQFNAEMQNVAFDWLGDML